MIDFGVATGVVAAGATDFTPWIAPFITVLFGTGGVLALLKIRPEAGQIAVNVAETVMKRLETEVERLSARVEDQELELEKCQETQRAYATLTQENGQLRRQLVEAQQAYDRLADEYAELQKKVSDPST